MSTEQRIEELEKLVVQLRDEHTLSQRTIAQLARVVTTSESTFQERTLSILRDTFHNLSEMCGMQLTELAERRDRMGQVGDVTFEVHIVDGEKVKETVSSIMITKTDKALLLSTPADPDNYVTGRGDHLIAWFAMRPHLFKDRNRIIFNYEEHHREQSADSQGTGSTEPNPATSA